jgi:predicted TIM-barrel fold metal-dependent hydrolase
MDYIDSHVHVWTDDTEHYPVAPGWKDEDVKRVSFKPEDFFKVAKPAGVKRANLIQMSFYTPIGQFSRNVDRFDNSYMLDMIALYKDVFCGTAVIDPTAAAPDRLMGELAKKKVRAFRIYPGLGRGIKPNEGKGENWLRPAGYEKMFAAAAKNNQAISCLINPDALPDLDRLCRKYAGAPVIIDHLCRIGSDGTIRDADVNALCDMAKHKKIMVKIGAFYGLGKKKPPYLDLAPLIRKVVQAFGVERCMWESDYPFQIFEHKYADSIELVSKRLDFLSAADKDWLLRRTAEAFFFPK